MMVDEAATPVPDKAAVTPLIPVLSVAVAAIAVAGSKVTLIVQVPPLPARLEGQLLV